jgi:hypothetical protein
LGPEPAGNVVRSNDFDRLSYRPADQRLDTLGQDILQLRVKWALHISPELGRRANLWMSATSRLWSAKP